MADSKMELDELHHNPSGSVAISVPDKKSDAASSTDVGSEHDLKSKKAKKGKKKKDDDSDSTEVAKGDDAEKKAVSYFTLYRFATKKDLFYIM
jgi:hypothetical protein